MDPPKACWSFWLLMHATYNTVQEHVCSTLSRAPWIESDDKDVAGYGKNLPAHR